MRRVTCNAHNLPLHLEDRDEAMAMEVLHPDGKACTSTSFTVAEVVTLGYAWGVLMDGLMMTTRGTSDTTGGAAAGGT
jgi:hypothetical protein